MDASPLRALTTRALYCPADRKAPSVFPFTRSQRNYYNRPLYSLVRAYATLLKKYLTAILGFLFPIFLLRYCLGLLIHPALSIKYDRVPTRTVNYKSSIYNIVSYFNTNSWHHCMLIEYRLYFNYAYLLVHTTQANGAGV